MSDSPRNYTSMGAPDFRKHWWEFLRQFPIWNPQQDKTFALIKEKDLQALLKDTTPEIAERIQKDVAYLEQELMPMFRERDFKAKLEQNRYRKFQIYFMALASAATFIGSLQVIVIDRPSAVSTLAFVEMFIALLATYIATIRGNSSPLQAWLMHRRRAESLRREYFRYIANIEPYDQLSPPQRRRTLSIRAADINGGDYPREAL